MATTECTVRGMTCGHCTAAVTEEVTAIPGVADISIDLVEGGDSTVTITSDSEIDIDKIRSAIAEAGYELVG